MEARQLTIEDILRQSVDVCERKSRGHENSKAAHEKIVHSKQQTYERILNYVKLKGGATSKEIARGLDKQLNCLSGRCSELKMAGKLRESGERREGASVLVIV